VTALEPTIVYPEKHFERAVATAVSAIDNCSIIAEGNFDLAIRVLAAKPKTIHIEVKAYGMQRLGGIGFGNSKGEGPQVDLLASEEICANRDQDVRWAFADGTREIGSRRYALLTCSEARRSAMATVCRGKQNNFRLASLQNHWIAWPQFCEQLKYFIAGHH
jgi:hypothetical protein